MLYRDQRTIAHSTALESITMDLDDDGGACVQQDPASDVLVGGAASDIAQEELEMALGSR